MSTLVGRAVHAMGIIKARTARPTEQIPFRPGETQ